MAYDAASDADLNKLVADLHRRMARTEAALEQIRKELAALLTRNLATCPACGTAFDILAHHTSIGLFSNTVYVKCPTCNHQMPIEGRGGTARAVSG